MSEHSNFAADIIPDRHVEVDAARLLIILSLFSKPLTDDVRQLKTFPRHEAEKHFTPEYYLHKIDFLLRYPGYLVYELSELHRLKHKPAENKNEMVNLIKQILSDQEPELKTIPFTRFWRGAYERLDQVEAWWYSRRLVYTSLERRGDGRPQKHYFISKEALSLTEEMKKNISHAKWYSERIELIHKFFGNLTAAQVKDLQYSHTEYKEAQLNEKIPDLTIDTISENYEKVFGEKLEASLV